LLSVYSFIPLSAYHRLVDRVDQGTTFKMMGENFRQRGSGFHGLQEFLPSGAEYPLTATRSESLLEDPSSDEKGRVLRDRSGEGMKAVEMTSGLQAF